MLLNTLNTLKINSNILEYFDLCKYIWILLNTFKKCFRIIWTFFCTLVLILALYRLKISILFVLCSVWVSLEDKPFQKKRVRNALNDPSDFKANCLFIIYLKYANLPWLREFSIVCISLWSDHTSDTNRGRNWLNPSLWRKEFLLTLWCYYCFFIRIRLDSRSNAKRRKYV